MDILKKLMWGQPPSAVQRAKLASRQQSQLQVRVPHFSRAFCARSGEVASPGTTNLKNVSKLIAFMSLAVLTACSPRDYLTRRLATDLIAASETFSTPQQFILHNGVMSTKDYA